MLGSILLAVPQPFGFGTSMILPSALHWQPQYGVRMHMQVQLLTSCSCASLQKISSQSIRTSEPSTLSERIYLYFLHDIIMDQRPEPAGCVFLSYFFCGGLENRGRILTWLCKSSLLLINTPTAVSNQIISHLICCHRKTSWTRMLSITKTSLSHSAWSTSTLSLCRIWNKIRLWLT